MTDIPGIHPRYKDERWLAFESLLARAEATVPAAIDGPQQTGTDGREKPKRPGCRVRRVSLHLHISTVWFQPFPFGSEPSTWPRVPLPERSHFFTVVIRDYPRVPRRLRHRGTASRRLSWPVGVSLAIQNNSKNLRTIG